MPPAPPHVPGVETADKVALHGVGPAEQGILPVDGAAIRAEACPPVAHFQHDAPRALPGFGVDRRQRGRHSVDGHGVRAQFAHVGLHPSVLVASAHVVFLTPRGHARHVVLRRILHRTTAQGDAQPAGTVQGDGPRVQPISPGHVAAVGPHAIVQPHVIVQPPAGDDHLQAGLLQDVHPVPMQRVLLPVLHRTYLHPPPHDGERHVRRVAQRIAQRIAEAVGSFLVNRHPAPLPVAIVQHAQAVARVDERLHILPVCPRIDIPVLLRTEAVDHTAEHLLAVHLEHHRVHAVAVGRTLHVVIRPDGRTHLSPSLHRLRCLERKRLRLLPPVHHPLARPGKEHDAQRARRRVVLHIRPEQRQRVHTVARLVLHHIQMQVRAERITRVPTQSNHLPRPHGILARLGRDVHLPALLGILPLLHPAGNVAHKSAEVPIDGRITIVIRHMQHITRPVRHPDARHITIGQRPHPLARHAARLKVQPPVEVVGPYLPEITTEGDGKIERRHKAPLLPPRHEHGQQHDAQQASP